MRSPGFSRCVAMLLVGVMGLCPPLTSLAAAPPTTTFTSARYGYSFEYPAVDWRLNVESEQEGVLEIVNLRPASGDDLIMVVVEANPGHKNASQWFQDLSSIYNLDLIEVQTDPEISGQAAILLRQPSSCGTVAMLVTILTVDDLAFTITYMALGEDIELPVYQGLLETFHTAQAPSAGNTVPSLTLPPPIPGDCPTAPDSPTAATRCPDAPFYIPAAGDVTTPYRCWMDSDICPEYRPGSPYGPYFESPHRGLDLYTGDGPGVVDVYPATTGVVSIIFNAQGVRLDHTSYDVSTYYAHMRNNDTGQSYVYVHVGDIVTGGQTVLGKTGNWGTAATHLHFSIFTIGTGETNISNTRNPTPYLRAEDLVYYSGWQRHAMECSTPVDTTPPTTVATYVGTPGANRWFISAVGVTLTATDNPGGSGLERVQYRLDSGSWTNYTGSFTISEEGLHHLEYQARDNEGNWEALHDDKVPIDVTAPQGSISLNQGAAVTYATMVHVGVGAADTASGIWHMALRDSGGTWGEWLPFQAGLYWILPAENGHSLGVEIKFQDYAGNESAVHVSSIVLRLHPSRPFSADYRLTKSTVGMSSHFNCFQNYCLGGTLDQTSGLKEMDSPQYHLELGYWRTDGVSIALGKIYLPLVTR